MPPLTRPRAQFAHKRTVRLIVDDELSSIDALKIAKSLPDFSAEIIGIVPLFGGKCFDITLATPDAAAKLAQEGIDFEQLHKPLRLLGQRSIHVSVFVSVEFPDEDLLNLLATYGELKSPHVRRLYFTEEGYTHIENGVRVVQFNKILRDIPKRVVLGGLEIGFKYSGQPVTCHRCQSTDHVVKNCPKRRQFPPLPPPPRPADGPADQQELEMDTSPSLFTQPAPSSYASAAATPSSQTEETPREFSDQLDREEEEAMQALRESRGRKRDIPTPSTSDDEAPTSKKPSNAEADDTNDELTDDLPDDTHATPETSSDNTSSTSDEPLPPPSPAGLRHFTAAMSSTGWERSALMKAISGAAYYQCRGCFLQHKYGNFTKDKARKHGARQEQEIAAWKALDRVIPQDAYAQLLDKFLVIQQDHKIFPSD